MASPSLAPNGSNGNAANLKLSLRDVLFLLILIAGIAGSFYAQSARIDALKDAITDMRQDIREIRHAIDRKP